LQIQLAGIGKGNRVDPFDEREIGAHAILALREAVTCWLKNRIGFQ